MKFKTAVLITFFIAFVSGCAALDHRAKPGNEMATKPENSSAQKPRVSGYAPVNGIKMYYEIHGPATGLPLVLIHGGGSTIDSAFAKFIPIISKNRQVIAIEEQGHGRTEGRPGPVSFTQTADDVAELMKNLKV